MKKTSSFWNRLLNNLGFARSRKHQDRRHNQPRGMRFEPLEVRQLLTVTVVDNQDAAYAETGSDWQSRHDLDAYRISFRSHASGTGENCASWTFEELDPTKQYQLYATWAARSNQATNAPFQVFDDTNALATVQVNQRVAPDDAWTVSQAWESLGVYDATSGTLVVQLSDNANGIVAADAVRVVEVSSRNGSPRVGSLRTGPDPVIEGATLHLEADGVSALGSVTAVTFWRDADQDDAFDPAEDQWLGTDADGSNGWTLSVSSDGFGTGEQRYFAQAVNNRDIGGRVATTTGQVGLAAILDDQGLGYSETGQGWTTETATGDIGGTHREHAAGSGQETAQWSFDGLPDGHYRVCINWTAAVDQASNAPFSIYDGTQLVGQVAVDQRVTPAGFEAEGRTWLELGVFAVTHGSVTVKLSNAADGVVAADAVYLADPPYVNYLSATPNPVGRGSSLQLTANVSYGWGPLDVYFFWDTDYDGYEDPLERVGSCYFESSEWSGNQDFVAQITAPQDLGVQPYYYAYAVQNWEQSYSAYAIVTVVRSVPTISSLTASRDGVIPGVNFTLTANASDTDGSVVGVSFYEDLDSDGVADANEFLAADTSSSGGWTTTIDTANWNLGTHHYLAVATDNDNDTSAPASATVEVGEQPSIDSVSASASAIAQGESLTLTATGVGAPTGQTVGSVKFYLDVSGGPDELIATDTDGNDGWIATLDTSGLSGAQEYYAVVLDSSDVASDPSSFANVTVLIPPTAWLSISHSGSTVLVNDNVTLTATASDSDGTITRVDFYSDNDSDGIPESLMGSDSNGSDGWEWPTTVYSWGQHAFSAVAVDNDNVSSDPAGDSVYVCSAPWVGSLTAESSEVIEGNSAVLTTTAGDSDGYVSGVWFYWETNSISGLQVGTGGDEALGAGGLYYDEYSNPYYQYGAGTSGLGGSQTYYAQAVDNDSVTADSTGVMVTIYAPPSIQSVSGPSVAALGEDLILTASGVSGGVTGVSFYRESDGISGLDVNADTWVASGSQGPGGWTGTIGTSGLSAGYSYGFYAVANGYCGATAVASMSVTVDYRPIIDTFSPGSSSIEQGGYLSLTAYVSAGASSVSYYWDSNNDGSIQGETCVGYGTPGSPVSFDTTNISTGSQTFLAEAYGYNGLFSALASTYVTIDPRTAVQNVSSTTTDGSYTYLGVINVTVAFNRDVTVSGTPQLKLNTGSTSDRYATYVSGSGLSTLTFEYTVQMGDNIADLDYASTNALELNGGSIQSAAYINCDLTLPTPGATYSLGANKALTLDTRLYWDADGSGTNTGGTGTWDNSSAETWRLGGPTSPLLRDWLDGADAAFPATAGTVTIAQSTTIHAASITFFDSGYTLAGYDSTSELSLPSGGTRVVIDSGSATIGAKITGTGGLTKTGSGNVTLSRTSTSNTYSGGTTVIGGTLLLSGTDNLLSTTGAITIAGGTLNLGGITQTTAGAISFQSGELSNGTLTNTGDDFDGQSGTISAVLDGAVGLTKSETGTLVLSGTNTYTGSTAVSDGILRLNNTLALGSTSSDLTVSGGMVDLYGHNITVGSLSGTGGTITDTTSNATPSTLTVDISTGSCDYEGSISDGDNRSVNLVKEGDGTLILSGDNSFNAMTVSDGTLQLGDDDALDSAGLIVGADGTVDLNGCSPTICSLSGAAGATIIDNIDSGGASTLTIDIASGSCTYAGSLCDGDDRFVNLVKAGDGTLELSGDSEFHDTTVSGGTLVLSGTNGYTDPAYVGDTTVNAGTLRIDDDTALGVADLIVNGGTVDLNGQSITLNSLSGDGGTIINNSSSTSSNLTVAISTGSYAYEGSLCDGENRYLNLFKTGDGTLELSGDNEFHDTTVSGGTLALSGTNGYAVVDAGDTAVNGATLVGTTASVKGDIAVASGAELVFHQETSGSFSGTISGAGDLTKAGSGTVTLPTANTSFTGETNVNVGTLCFADGALGSGNIIISNDGILRWASGNDENISTRLSAFGDLKVVTLDTNGNDVSLTIPDGSSGTLVKAGSGTLCLYDSATSPFTGGLTATSGVLTLSDDENSSVEWSNIGSLSINGGTIDLDGDVIWKTGATFSGAVGTVNVKGTLHISDTLDLGSSEGCWNLLSGGTIDGGTIAGDSGSWIKCTSGTLNGVTLDADLKGATTQSGLLTIVNGLTLNSSLSCSTRFTGTQTLGGSGEICLIPGNSITVVSDSESATLTVASGITIHGAALISSDPINGPVSNLVNYGTFRADIQPTYFAPVTKLTTGGIIDIGLPLYNYGTLIAVGAGMFAIDDGGNYHTIQGTRFVVSDTELSVSWRGLDGDSQCSLQTSTDGAAFSDPISTTTTAGAASSLITGLPAGLDSNVRITATNRLGGKEIYETGDVAIPTPVAPVTGAWYRFCSVTSGGVVLEPTRVYEELPGAIAESNGVRINWSYPATAFDSSGNASDLGMTDFALNTGWIYANSLQGAATQALQGLVTDGSVPSVSQSGTIDLEFISLLTHFRGEGLPDEFCIGDGSTWVMGPLASPIGSYPTPLAHSFIPSAYPAHLGSIACSFIPETIDLCSSDISSSKPCPKCPCDTPATKAVKSWPDSVGDGSPPSAQTNGSIISVNTIDATGGCAACGMAVGGLTYSSREFTLDSGFGPGWTDSAEQPSLVLSDNGDTVTARFGAETTITFDAQTGGGYVARYGVEQTLTYNSSSHLFVLCAPNGSFYEFYGSGADHPEGALCRSVAADGATVEVTGWTESGDDGKPTEIQYRTTPNGTAYQRRLFTYWSGGGGEGHVRSVTLQEYRNSQWFNGRRMNYTYYDEGDSHGLLGDLKSIVTQEWDDSLSWWTGHDTNYFRYYTDASLAHAMKRVLLPNAYAAFFNQYGDPEAPANAGDGQSDPIANYTCFYYEYDADRRVTKQVLFGKTNQSEYVTTLSYNAHNYNNWHHKTVEILPNSAVTAMVKDINDNTSAPSPDNLVNVNGTLFFTASDDDHGTELWSSNGTAGGTNIVLDICPGIGSSAPGHLTDVNGTLFFTANDGVHGTELWKSDGVTTTQVADICSGMDGSSPTNLINVNGTLYFTADDGNGPGLWKSNGTALGTVLLYSNDVGDANLAYANGTLYFTVDSQQYPATELWRINPLNESAAPVDGVLGIEVHLPANLTSTGSTLFFAAESSTNGRELYKTDRTGSTCLLVKDICSGAASSSPENLTDVNGTLYFTANDGTHGSELWRSDGTIVGTFMVLDMVSGTGGSSVTNLTNVNGTLYFTANDGANGTELWMSDGTAGGTVMVENIGAGATGSSPANLTNVNGTLYFTADDGNGTELWMSDGTPEGTVMAKDISSLATGSSPANLTNVNGTLYFTANDGTHGSELWGKLSSTVTVYTNYLGQTLLSDVYDPVTQIHTINYNRYDENANVVLSVAPSAFVLYGGKYYDDSLPDLVDFASDSPYLSNTDGLFQITTYYTSTSVGIDEDTAGGVEGYKYQTAVANGEQMARLAPGSTNGPVLLSSYTYFSRTVDDQTIYPVASYTNYSSDTSAGLVAHWAMDDQAGTTASDSSGNGHDATLVNSPTWTADGQFNGALSFNGTNSYLSVPATGSSPLEFTGGEMTLSAWVYVNPTETTGGYLVSKPWNGSDEYNYYLRINASGQAVFGLQMLWGAGNIGTEITSSVSLSASAWHRIVATVDASNSMKIYVDGTEVASGSHSIANWTPQGGDSDLPLAIGAIYPYGTSAYNFDGKLDDVRIYDRAFSAGEVAAGEATTSYAYTWNTDTFQIQQQTTTLPAVAAAQNGSGVSATAKQSFDDQGNLVWSKDELGRVTYYGYDLLTDRMTRMIEDVDSDLSASLQPPTGFAGNSDGLHQTSDYQYDALGRVTQILGPAHTIDLAGTATNVRTATWVVHKDAAHEKRTAQGYATESTPNSGNWDTFAILGPISITKTDRDGRTIEQIQAIYSGTLAALATATISQSNYTAWTTYQYANTRLASTRLYHTIPASGTGAVGTNYDQTTVGYETYGASQKGRQNKIIAADGTITRVVLDARGNVIETWIGTNDTGATDADPTGNGATGNNMVKLSSAIYDADGNLTESYSYYDSGTTDYYDAFYRYDERNQLTSVLDSADVVTHYEYDNLGRTTCVAKYASDDFTLDTDELLTKTEAIYDSRGRVHETRVFEVDQQDSVTPGTVRDYLPTKTWYDAAGNAIKTQTGAGPFTKNQYDGLGRVVATYTSYDTGAAEANYTAADDVMYDTVIQQTAYWYDGAGQTVATATYQRIDGITTTTGDLTAANSYATASVAWYDAIGRLVATANYGREDTRSGAGLTHYFFDGTTGALIDTGPVTPDGIPDAAQAARPRTLDENALSLAGLDFQLQITQYDSAGRAYRTLDNLGRINQTQYDDAGRTVRTIQNYVSGTVEETDTEQDVTVDYEYSFGRLVTMTVHNAKGSGNGVETQATRYLYESPYNASWQTAAVYPDSTDVLSQNSTTNIWTITTNNGDHTSSEYDRLGRLVVTQDQRGVNHEYAYDSAGRLWLDTVDLNDVHAGQNVDDSVLRIATTYDDVGRVQTVTSYSDTSGTTAVNQVLYVYNGWGQVYREYEEHNDEVNTATTPFVQYDYADGASGGIAQYNRLSKVTYPNGRKVHYGYDYGAAATDDIMSRLSAMFDDANNNGEWNSGEAVYTVYKYLGAGTIVEEDYEDIDVKLSYLDSSGNVTGLDRFGRVVDQVWKDGLDQPIDRYTYTYDRAGNRTARNNELHSLFDEDYLYDALDRLETMDRADGFDQAWTLDGLGNFATFDDDGASQDRTTNAANEIQSISGSANWKEPVYDAAGNMISGPKTGAETVRVHYVYDAWNRLVAVYADDAQNPGEPGDLIAEYRYDGANRRVTKTLADGTSTEYYYNRQWQLLEARTFDADSDPLGSQVYVWSWRYIDAPVLRDTYDDDGVLEADSRRYYTGDANYNVTGLLDADGVVTNRCVYSAYGEATVYDANWANAAAPSADGPLYCGYWFDAETRLYHVRNRYYSFSTSTFVNRDPLVYGGGDFNLYAYCGNEPLNRVDPNGTWYWVNGAGEYCGPYVKLYTGWWCVKPNVWEAAMDAAGGVVTCWWDCEIGIHKCACAYAADAAGAACTITFTHYEIGKGAVRQGLGKPGDITTLQSALALWMAQHGYKGYAHDLLRGGAHAVSNAKWGTGIQAGVAGVSIVEAGFSIYCGWKCSK